jgi:4-amino-4-deoxy-L-arabinose transferase-like glycosyltransferase
VKRILGIVPRAFDRPITASQAALGIALVLSLVLRAGPLLVVDFPLGDGGLFVTMARDIRAAHFALPATTSFNGGGLPFAYPPLGLYVLALLPGDPIATERWLPLVYSLLTVPAVYLLARELTDPLRASISALIFAAMPITWVIEGGGVTRGLGMMLLAVSLWRLAVLLKRPSPTNVLLAGISAGLALLSHPGVGPTGVASAVLIWFHSPSRARLVALAWSAMVVLVIAGPYLVTLLVRYGANSIATAAQAHVPGDALIRLLTVGPSWITPDDFVVPLALLGTVLAIHRREWLLPTWVALLVLVPGGEGRLQAPALSMLATTGAVGIAAWLKDLGALRLASGIALSWLVIASFFAGYPRFHALSPQVRAAMAEAGRATNAQTRFAVVSDNRDMEEAVLDWFPTISGRRSLGTFLGLEWTTLEQWTDVASLNRDIQRGLIPSDADAVFTVRDETANVKLTR